jgi:hypothetical protein
MAKKAKATKTAKKVPKTKGRFYEGPSLVHSKRDPNSKSERPMSTQEREVQAILLESIELNPARAEEGPGDFWALTLRSGHDERV